MVEDPLTLWLVAGLFISTAVLGILFLIIYNKYYALKHDTSKTVVLRDLSGTKYKLGKYCSPGITRPALQINTPQNPEEPTRIKGQKETDPKPTITVQTEKGELQQWIVDIPVEYSLMSVSVDYGDELAILTDFQRTDLNRHIIAPLVDKSILDLGLRRGVYALLEKNNTLVQQNEYLKNVVKEREDLIQKISIEYDSDKLEFITKAKSAIKTLIEEVKKHFLQDILWVKGKAQNESKSRLGAIEAIVDKDLQKLEDEARSMKLKGEEANKQNPLPRAKDEMKKSEASQ